MGISIVTGANRGIGLALVQTLSQRGAKVLATCRTSSDALDSLGVEVLAGVDVTAPDAAARVQEAVGDREVDLLINNAGILIFGDNAESPDYEGMTKQFEVNAVGPVRMTLALKDKFHSGSKVAFITSRMGSIADNSSGGTYGYRMSKAALNIAAVSLAQDFREAGVSVVILHPGMVKTEMIGGHGQVEPADAAAGLIARIDELALDTTGKFFHQNGEELPW